MKISSIKHSVITLFILTFALTANAQGVPSSIQGISLTLSTVNPTPGQTLTVTAESYVTDLNASNITWKLNGSVFQSGPGITSIEVQAPALGKQLTVSVSATTPEGRTLATSININSGKIDLILENDGYVPPFFKGKIPLSYQNNYRIIAFPHLANSSGVEYDPKTLVYTWSKDSSVIQDQGGYGKQVFSWKDDIIPRQRMIDVKVSTRDGSAQAEKVIAVQAGSPSITFYPNDPLYGPLYNNAVGDSTGLGKGGELSVLAVPYGFNAPLKKLTYIWMINSNEQQDLSSSQSITLRSPANTSGSSAIQLQINNTDDFLQTASNAFTAIFGGTGNQTQTADPLNNYNGL